MFKKEEYHLTLFFKFFFLIAFIAMLLVFISASQTNSSNYGMDVDVSSGGGNISSTNYKTDVISGTITGNASSSFYSQSFGFFSCVPYTCSGLGYNCGTWDDGCGGTLNCGSCASGYTCSSGTCVAVPVTPGAGGGAAVGVIIGPDFTLSRDLIHVIIKQGESKREIIEIKNTGSTSLNISLELENIEKFMAVSEKTFFLSLQETKSIFIDIFAKEEEIPDAYTGRIIIKGDGLIKIINVIIEVKERKPLFDVIVQVLTKEVLAGKNVKAKLKVFNLGDLRNIDIKIYYSIQDFDGKILSFKEETTAINEELKITRTLRVPKGTPVGDYVFYFKASYLNISASSTETFEVVEREIPSLFLILLIFVIILMIIILIFMFIIFKRFLNRMNKKREIKIKEMKPQEKVKIEPKRGRKGRIQEKKEPKLIKLIRPKIKPTKEIKEKKKPKKEKRILKKEKKVKRKLLKKIKKAVKKKKRKEKIDDLKRLIERKKKNLKYKRKVRKELRKSKRRRKPLYSRLEKIRRKRYENLLKKIIAMRKKKKSLYREYPPNSRSNIERTRKEIRKRGI